MVSLVARIICCLLLIHRATSRLTGSMKETEMTSRPSIDSGTDPSVVAKSTRRMMSRILEIRYRRTLLEPDTIPNLLSSTIFIPSTLEDLSLVDGSILPNTTKTWSFPDNNMTNVPVGLDVSVFQTHRAAPAFTYTLGGFTAFQVVSISMGFAETYVPNCVTAKRRFNIDVNGLEFQHAVDIFGTVGCNAALVLTQEMKADANGLFTISFSSVKRDPLVCFIAIDTKSATTSGLMTAPPTVSPTLSPSDVPSKSPVGMAATLPPTTSPITSPPSLMPTTLVPTFWPTTEPSDRPIIAATFTPTAKPSASASSMPTFTSSTTPSGSPSSVPTAQVKKPTLLPTTVPISTTSPTVSPSQAPGVAASAAPTISTPTPTTAPITSPPSPMPTTLVPTFWPTTESSDWPSASPMVAVTFTPTAKPSVLASSTPTIASTTTPSDSPSSAPISQTETLTASPTAVPISTTNPTVSPSQAPTEATSATPTVSTPAPTTLHPTDSTSLSPTIAKTSTPTASPTQHPSISPIVAESSLPTVASSMVPSDSPSNGPSTSQTTMPTGNSITAKPTIPPINVLSDSPSQSPINNLQTSSVVASVWLVNSSTKESIMPLFDGAQYDLADVGTDLSIMVETAPVGFVQFGYDGTTQKEGISPYVLGGKKGVVSYWPVEYLTDPGMKTIEIQAFLLDGSLGERTQISFHVTSSMPSMPVKATKPVVQTIQLVDALTTNPIGPLPEGSSYSVSELGTPSLSIVVEASPKAHYVRFIYDNHVKIEGTGPFVLGGKDGASSGYFPVEYLTYPGTKTITIDVFSKENTVIESTRIIFSVES